MYFEMVSSDYVFVLHQVDKMIVDELLSLPLSGMLFV